MSHPLDRPVWGALTSGWRALAEGDERARRLERGHGVFGAAADRSDDSLAALAALIPEEGELWTVEREGWPTPSGVRVDRTAMLVQMVCASLTSAPQPEIDIVDLTEDDAADMLALTTLTKPGPYVRHTNRLGHFVGVRADVRWWRWRASG